MEPKKDLINLLDIVPNEIWKECWWLVTRDDLKSLSYVCQRFRLICQSLLFASFTISISRIVQGPMFTIAKSDLTIIREKIEGLRAFISRQYLVDSVRRLIISTNYLETAINRGADRLFEKTEAGEAPLLLFLTTIFAILPAFSKTKRLILDWPMILSEDCLDMILELAAQHLPIEDLTLAMEDIPSKNFDKFPSLKVLALGKPSYKNLGVDSQPDEKISIPASVEYLFSQSTIVAPKVILGLDQLHQNLISFELSLGRSSFPLFLQCLSFCPRMKYIVIHTSSRTTCDAPLRLSETTIPKLETFIGPLELALVIAPKRPISCLGMIERPWETAGNNTILRDMTQLARSTGPVAKLSFDLRVDQRATLPTIINLFPTLSLLNIGFHYEGIPISSQPEQGVQIKDGRLEGQIAWEDSESLENFTLTRSGYKGLIFDFALGRLQLPSTLEILRLDIHLNTYYMDELEELSRDLYYFEPFTFRMARRVVYALTKQYSRLRQVHIGWKKSKWIWARNEGTWQAQEERY